MQAARVQQPELNDAHYAQLDARAKGSEIHAGNNSEHLPAQSGMVPVQGLLTWGHLPAQSDKEPVQDAQGGQGRVDAAGSGGALKTLAPVKTSFRSLRCSFEL